MNKRDSAHSDVAIGGLEVTLGDSVAGDAPSQATAPEPDMASKARAPLEAAGSKPESHWRLVTRRFLRSRSAIMGALLVLALIMSAVFADFLSPYDPTLRDSANFYMPPNAIHFVGKDGFSPVPYVHPLETTFDPNTFAAIFASDTSKECHFQFLGQGWRYRFLGFEFDRHLLTPAADCAMNVLGTDSLGRDMLSRILVGSRLTLIMAGLVVAVSITIGTLVGLVSGYFGGIVDLLLQRVTEFILALPELPFFLALVAIMPRNASPTTVFFLLAAILSLLKWAGLAREVRGKTLALSRVDYILSAEALGAGNARIILRHLLPNIISHVIVVTTLMIPQIILAESFLSFLGVGVQPPLVSWGLLLNAAKDMQNLGSYPWMLMPVGCILIAVLGFNLFGDGLRDAIDPYAN